MSDGKQRNIQKLHGYLIKKAPKGYSVFSQVLKEFISLDHRLVTVERSESIDLSQSQEQVIRGNGVSPNLHGLYDFFIHKREAHLNMEFIGGSPSR